jgi:hypothetical protein
MTVAGVLAREQTNYHGYTLTLISALVMPDDLVVVYYCLESDEATGLGRSWQRRIATYKGDLALSGIIVDSGHKP